MSTARYANGKMQVKDGSFTKNCFEVETRPLINTPTSSMDQTLVEKLEQRSSSQDQLLISHKERRSSPQKFDALKIQIGAFPGSPQEAKMQGNILANNDRNSNFQQNVNPSEKIKNVRPSKKMKKNNGSKNQRWMSLFDENRKDDKTEVSEVPQDSKVRDGP